MYNDILRQNQAPNWSITFKKIQRIPIHKSMDVRKCDIRVVSKPLYGARYAANRGLALYFWHSEDLEKSNIASLNASTMNTLTPTFKNRNFKKYFF